MVVVVDVVGIGQVLGNMLHSLPKLSTYTCVFQGTSNVPNTRF